MIFLIIFIVLVIIAVIVMSYPAIKESKNEKDPIKNIIKNVERRREEREARQQQQREEINRASSTPSYQNISPSYSSYITTLLDRARRRQIEDSVRLQQEIEEYIRQEARYPRLVTRAGSPRNTPYSINYRYDSNSNQIISDVTNNMNRQALGLNSYQYDWSTTSNNYNQSQCSQGTIPSEEHQPTQPQQQQEPDEPEHGWDDPISDLSL